MSCAWNQYCVMVHESYKANELILGIGKELIKKSETPAERIAGERLVHTSLYCHLDMLVFERDNYITLIGDDMERNGDSWIIYMAQTLRDKNLFEWIRVYMNIPFEIKEKYKHKIRLEDYYYEKEAGRTN